jgi:hypothetical protein
MVEGASGGAATYGHDYVDELKASNTIETHGIPLNPAEIDLAVE